MVEVPHLMRIEGNGFGVVHANGEHAIVRDVFDGTEVAIGDIKLSIGRAKPETVPYREGSLNLAVGADARGVGRDCR